MIFDVHTHICAQRGSVEELIAELRRADISGTKAWKAYLE